jgi:hypothetical protein
MVPSRRGHAEGAAPALDVFWRARRHAGMFCANPNIAGILDRRARTENPGSMACIDFDQKG